jgi:transcriptional regulator with XRE-family HTH domain
VAARQVTSRSSAEANHLAVEVGARIRALRTGAGVSLGMLAGESGLGKGTLSELERGQRNPTLETLYAVATALRLPLSHLLVDSAPAGIGPGGPLASTARGRSVVANLLDRWSDDEGLCEVYRVSLEDRIQRSKPHLAGVVETLTVIGGTAEVGAADSPVTITTAESHTFPGDVPHLYRGIGGVATGVLTMYYPRRAGSAAG